jgi:hypothetical protein
MLDLFRIRNEEVKSVAKDDDEGGRALRRNTTAATLAAFSYVSLRQALAMDLRAWFASKCGIAEGHAQELAVAFASDYWIENSTELSARHCLDPCIVDNLSAPSAIKVAIKNALSVGDGASATGGPQPVKRTLSPLGLREQYDTRRNGVHVPFVTHKKTHRNNSVPQPATDPIVQIQRALQKKGYGEQMNALVRLHGICKRGKRFCSLSRCTAHNFESIPAYRSGPRLSRSGQRRA